MAFNNLFAFAARAPRLFGRGLVTAYRYTLAPLLGPRCRHLPTCSEYGDESLARFGLWAGGWMTLARICRCHPFGTSGLDFVPQTLPPRARWYLPWRYGRWTSTNQDAGNTDRSKSDRARSPAA
ncbi:MAG TPA: membrane protein insertion efficiency factor YidD [Pseudolabrys sp.]|nr:membrane protein insertion efficiency factor YidD [Pseudolabrys sp.]